jgi:hypothetical protein
VQRGEPTPIGWAGSDFAGLQSPRKVARPLQTRTDRSGGDGIRAVTGGTSAAPRTVWGMTDLRHVWVYGADAELIRADQIISVYAHEPSDEQFDYGAVKPDRLARGTVLLCAEVPGGRKGATSRRVWLMRGCPAPEAERLLAQLVYHLAEAAAAGGDDVAPCLYVYPSVDKENATIRWEVGAGVPDRRPDVPSELASADAADPSSS